MNPIGEKTRSIASLQGTIVPTIGKCIGIMGGRIQFAPTILNYYHGINPDSKPGLQASQNQTRKILFIIIPFKVNIQKINNLKMT